MGNHMLFPFFLINISFFMIALASVRREGRS